MQQERSPLYRGHNQVVAVCIRSVAEVHGSAVRNHSAQRRLRRAPERARTPLRNTHSGKRGETVNGGSPGAVGVAGAMSLGFPEMSGKGAGFLAGTTAVPLARSRAASCQ